MTIKSVVCACIAFTFLACDKSPTEPHYPVIVHTLTSDSYDSGGNISIYDSRLKKTHHYTVILVITQNGEDPLKQEGNEIADSLIPHQQFFKDMAEEWMDQNSLDFIVSITEGFIRIADPNRTILAYAEVVKNAYDSDNKFAHLVIHFAPVAGDL
ncbi:MAG: hypothetical protein OXH16_07610 [Gemmatimonadetes bacterium]|nr:hypothetical protein [Gemmatimonadota bacterium]